MNQQGTLFDMAATRSGQSTAVKLTAFKKQHGILTHRSGCRSKGELPWMALLPFEEDKGKALIDIVGSSARLYEETKYCTFGEGELTTVRELCRLRGIPCEL